MKRARGLNISRSVERCSTAANEGYLKFLQWVRTQGCPWDIRVCTLGAAGGHLRVLHWATEQGCLWHTRPSSEAAK